VATNAISQADHFGLLCGVLNDAIFTSSLRRSHHSLMVLMMIYSHFMLSNLVEGKKRGIPVPSRAINFYKTS
jgi:hypothetical protein